MKRLRLALFTDSAPQLFARALGGVLAQRGVKVEMKVWGFTSPLAVTDALTTFAPDVVLVWAAAEAEQFPEMESLVAFPYRWVLFTMATRDDGCYGNFAVRHATSLRARILQWNAELVALAQRVARVSIVDLDLLQSQLGRGVTFDARLWETAGMALTPFAATALAERTADVLGVPLGCVRKVLVTDLDGTLWDGIVSEVGPEGINPSGYGRRAYRRWLQRLAARGILLAVASRNDRGVAESAFDHPEMEMSPLDFSAFEADWGPKSEMLKRIAEQLHVGLESFVFIDDRAEVRGEVRAMLPEVTVPEMPTDAATWVEFLTSQSLFETAQLTDEDTLRVASLQADAERATAAQMLSSEAYLASLEQVLIPEPLGPQNVARAAQLTQRCNQFNMRMTRATEADLLGRKGWVYRLRDKYGDLGIVSAVVMDGDFIETWVLSCRAFHRGIEEMILDHLKTCGPIRGAYVPGERNHRCATVYEQYGVAHV